MKMILFTSAAVLCLAPAARAATVPAPNVVREVVVTASTENQIGVATTSSQGSVTKQELDLRPVYRVGQLLETVPGLTVTAHSGEGKANQYLLRGFNLDHGTDLATYVDGMPVNMRTHAHGQGYTDLNFMIPELATGVKFTKGPYFAAEGDYSSVGAVRIGYADYLPTQVAASAGTVGDRRVFAAGTHAFGMDDRVLAAGEFVTLDGPWDHPDKLRKTNLALRYSHGEAADGYALTGMYYRGTWNATTDQPERAITLGLISPFGALDPTDGGKAERYSLSARYAHGTRDWRVNAEAYVIKNRLTLWNNFTHFLDDPINGDQEAQNDRRTIWGGSASYTLYRGLMSRESDTTFGVQARYDDIYVDRQRTKARAALSTHFADRVKETSIGVYAQNTTFWNTWLRSIVGVREDWFHASDDNLVGGLSGSESKAIFQPKGSIVFGPWAGTEIYLSAGKGFHSNDTRAGDTGGPTLTRPPFLVASRGEEIGVRSILIPHVTAAVTVFQMEFDSELTYNADVGATEAGRPSRRRGVEFTGQYRPFPWLELNANIAISRARYTDADPAGPYIEDAPRFVGSAGVLVDNLGPWFGAVQFRDLGAHPLTSDNAVRSDGYREINASLGYKITPSLKIEVDVYNLTNAKADAADYYYTSRLPGEPAAGVDDLHIHPLEPRSARFTVRGTF
jgi:hypothetical protein